MKHSQNNMLRAVKADFSLVTRVALFNNNNNNNNKVYLLRVWSIHRMCTNLTNWATGSSAKSDWEEKQNKTHYQLNYTTHTNWATTQWQTNSYITFYKFFSLFYFKSGMLCQFIWLLASAYLLLSSPHKCVVVSWSPSESETTKSTCKSQHCWEFYGFSHLHVQTGTVQSSQVLSQLGTRSLQQRYSTLNVLRLTLHLFYSKCCT